MDNEVDIRGLDKAELLAALYNNSQPMGMGFLQAREGEMAPEKAREILGVGDGSARLFPKSNAGRREMCFDYLYGRPLKVRLDGDVLRTALYNRDNGLGAAERIVSELRAKQGA